MAGDEFQTPFERDIGTIREAVEEALEDVDLEASTVTTSARAIGDSGYVNVKAKRDGDE